MPPRHLTAAALALAALATAALGAVRLSGCGSAPARRPNVLLVLWDTVRADHLTPYGYAARPTTPRLDAFARESTLYERATSRGMWTLPSHAAMFTGLAESTHGAVARTYWLDNHHQTLAERLGAAGWDTFAFSANIIVSPEGNLLQGFDTVESSYPRPDARRGRYLRAAREHTASKLLPDDASNEIAPGFRGSDAERWDRARFKDAGPVAHRALVDWLAERPGAGAGAPWFAYLNLMEAHSPRIPSLAARQAVIGDEDLIALGLRTDASVFALMEWTVGKREMTPDQIRAVEAVYDASLRDLDDATGDLLDDLRARGILDDTVVIVVADHGELLGEHRAFEHRWAVWDPLLHVPLLVRYPAAFAPGRRVAERVSTGDLFSTVVELAGLPRVPGVESASLVGRAAFEPAVVSQMLDPFSSMAARMHETYPDVDLTWVTRTSCVAYGQDDWKLVYWSTDRHELYDLSTDPGERVNRYATEPGRAAALEDALLAFEDRLTPYDPTLRDAHDLRMVRRNEKRFTPSNADSPEAQALAALGYVGGDLGIEQAYPQFCGPRERRSSGR